MKLSKCVSGVTAFGLAAFAAGVVGLSSPVFAACPVPHSLTNGQVADASEVMENFEAVAACADDVVELDGTAASGNIAVFSGTQTVTGGNLTGDITTSGTTATTLSATGVTPGMYPNATITVDAKGRVTAASVGSGGGGGTGIYRTLVQLRSGFNLGSSAFANVNWGSTGMVIDQVGAWNSSSPTLLTVPAGYSLAEVRISMHWANNNSGRRWAFINHSIYGAIAADLRNAAWDTSVSISSKLIPVSAGETIKLYAGQDSGSTIGLTGNSSDYVSDTWMEVRWYP